MIRYLDFSDDYFGGREKQAGPHPSDNIGALLAAAESSGGSGRALVLGVVVAYEACGQLVENAILHSARGWDYPIMHAVASVLGAGSVLGLGETQLRHALGMAVVSNVTLRQTRIGELSMWKALAGPHASRHGLLAAMLAARGVSGPGEPFSGRCGFVRQLETPFELGELGGEGRPYRIEGTYFKALPVMYSLQLPVWTALALRKKVDVTEIEAVTAYVDGNLARNDAFSSGRTMPATRETADHSGPYLMAAALVDGTIDEKTMTPARYRDPSVLELARRIRVAEDPEYSAAYPDVWNCRLEAKLRSGATVIAHERNPRGHPANPLSDAEISRKFMEQAAPRLGERKARGLLERLWNIDGESDLGAVLGSGVVDIRNSW